MNIIKYKNSSKIFIEIFKSNKDILIYCEGNNKKIYLVSHRILKNHLFSNYNNYEVYTKNLLESDPYSVPNILTGNIYIDLKFLNYIKKINIKKILFLFKETKDVRYTLSKIYREYLLENLNIIVGIYTCKYDEKKLTLLKSSEWFEKYSKYKNIQFIDVYAGSNITCLSNSTLNLKTEESYGNLSMKSYYMIDYIYNNFDFDYFMKLDCGIINRPTNIRQFTFNNFVNNFENKLFYREYDGVLNVENHTFKSIHGWANGKGFSVDPESIFIKESNIPDFWGGNCYVLNKNNCGIISNNKQNFQLFKDKMAGCEDLCVGYTLKQNGVANWES